MLQGPPPAEMLLIGMEEIVCGPGSPGPVCRDGPGKI